MQDTIKSSGDKAGLGKKKTYVFIGIKQTHELSF